MSARARENLYKTPRPSDPRLEIVSDENDSDSSTRGKGVKRFSTGVGPQAPKARKKSSGILSSFSGFFRSIFGSSEEEEDSFEKDLSNRGVLHASNSDKTMSSSSDIIYEGRNHSPDVLCTSSKKSVLKHQPKQLELEESQDEEEIEVIDEVHNSRPSDLLNDRKSIDEMLEAVKAADVVLGDDDESSSGSISIISDNLNGAKGSSPCPEDSISRQNTPNRFRADDFHTPRTDSWARRRKTREHPIPRVKTPARSSERTASKSFKANSVYHTPENLGSFLDGAGSLLAYDKLLKDRLSASARRTPSGYIDKPKTEVRRVRTISVNYVLRAKSAMRKHRSRQASEVITLEDDIKRESPLIVLDDEPSSNKSETASISSYLSSGREKVDDLIASIASINLKTNGALEQYNKYKTSRKYRTKQERELEETNRQLQQIRNLHEVDLAEDVRQKLALGGIRPPLPKPKVKEEFPDLPPEALELCERAWISGSPMEVFCEGFDIKILRKDLVTLKPGAWLNDEVIVFFLSLVVDRSKNDASLPKAYTFNTFFYVNISTKGYASVKRWTRKVDIFAYDVLLIPVHVGGVHWCMAIVDFGEKTIEYFDSLGGSDNGALSYIQNYLREESKDKKKIEFDFSDWEFIIRSDCPRQSNGFDCGVFSVHVAEYCSRRAQLTFSQKHMEYFRKRMVYEIVSKKLM